MFGADCEGIFWLNRVYNFETGQVFAYDPGCEQFKPIEALALEGRDVAGVGGAAQASRTGVSSPSGRPGSSAPQGPRRIARATGREPR